MAGTLVVCTHHPLPEISGAAMRTMHFVRFFQELGPVDLAYTHTTPDTTLATGAFRREIQLPLKEQAPGRSLLEGLVAPPPLPLYRYADPNVATAGSGAPYDQILVRSLYCAPFADALSPAQRRRVILDLDDSVSGTLYDSLIAGSGAPQRALLELNRRIVRRYERRAVRAAGTGTVCANADAQRLRIDGVEPIVVPNIYATTRTPPAPDDRPTDEHRLLFVGSLNYAPNVEGLRWFVQAVLPLVMAAYPSARLVVVGQKPTDEVRALCASRPEIELHANVPDPLEYYASSRAVVVPLLAGGGTRIKILEAAFARRPVLSTAIGAEGLDVRAGRDFLGFETPEEFVRSYARLDDDALRQSLVDNAHAVLSSTYSTDGLRRVLRDVVDRLGTRVP